MRDLADLLNTLEQEYCSAAAKVFSALPHEDADLGSVYVKLHASQYQAREMRECPKKPHGESASQPDKRRSEQPSSATSLQGILSNHQHVVFLGDPGSGRSTTLQYIAMCFAQEGMALAQLGLVERRIPVLLSGERRYWVALAEQGVETCVEEEVSRFLSKAHHMEAQSLVDRWLTSGRLIILIDGLDEVPEGLRDLVAGNIRRFVAIDRYRTCRLVVSSQLSGYRRFGRPFSEWRLLPLEVDDLESYVAGWLAVRRGRELEEVKLLAAGLVARAQREPGLRPILSNPLLLRLLVYAPSEIGQLPSSALDVITLFIEGHAWQRATRRRTSEWSLEDCCRALTRIAWTMHNSRAMEVSEDVLVRALQQNIPEVGKPRDLTRFLCEGMGLLRSDGPAGHLAFGHALFQEYFVAAHLASSWRGDPTSTWKYIKPRLHLPEWRTLLAMVPALLKPPASHSYVSHILEARSPYERLLRRDVLLCGSCLAWGAPVQDDLRKRILHEMLSVYLEIPEYQDRVEQPGQGERDHYRQRTDAIERALETATADEELWIEQLLLDRIVLAGETPQRLALVGTALRESAEWFRLVVRRRLSRRLEVVDELDLQLRGVFSLRGLWEKVATSATRSRYWHWYREVGSVIRAISRLRVAGARTTETLIRLLEAPGIAGDAANALAEVDNGRWETAKALLDAVQSHRATKGWDTECSGIVDALGRLAQKNNHVVDELLAIVNRPGEDKPPRDLGYPVAMALCRTAETSTQAMAFLLDCWDRMSSQETADQLDESTREGIKAGTRTMLEAASEEVLAFLIDRIGRQPRSFSHAARLLEQVLGSRPRLRVREADAAGNVQFRVVEMYGGGTQRLRESFLGMITTRPPIGGPDEDPLIGILTQWMLTEPGFLARLVAIVNEFDPRLLAEGLRHDPPEPVDKEARRFYEDSIARLLSSNRSVAEEEFSRWQRAAEGDEEGGRLATWYLNVVNWQKCYLFFGAYWRVFGTFWGRDGWEKVKLWNPYSMAALACFREWSWAAPFATRARPVGWRLAREEFRKQTKLAISMLEEQDRRAVDVLVPILAGRPGRNGGEDARFAGGEAFKLWTSYGEFEERIAAAYGLAGLSGNHPDVRELLREAAQQLLDKATTHDDSSVDALPINELREHCIRALGYVHRPGRDVVSLMLQAAEKDQKEGRLSVMEAGIEAIETPAPGATDCLLEVHDATQNEFLRWSLLKALSTVSPPTLDITERMLSAVDASDIRTRGVGSAYLSHLPGLDARTFRKLAQWAKRNGSAMAVLAHHADTLGRGWARRLARTAARKASGMGDSYGYALSRFVGRLTVLNAVSLPYELIVAKRGPEAAVRERRRLFWLLTGGVALSAISSLASDVLAGFLQERYRIVTDESRAAIVGLVLITSLAATVLIARGRRANGSLDLGEPQQ